MFNLGNLLKELREEKNVSMDKMIEDIKKIYSISIAKSTISKWENNKADPSLENAKILCKYFNISLDYLLGVTDDPTPNKDDGDCIRITEARTDKNGNTIIYSIEDKQNDIANNKESILLDIFNKLNDEGKDEAIKRVDELTELSKYKKEDTKIVKLPNKDDEYAKTLEARRRAEQYFKENPHLMPIASHDREGEFTEEDYKHDDDIMNDDDFWK
ncbi:MAG: helix-turn-helix domain-containing protein [Clostridium paraputrificum]